jgi:hypothetical protein
VVPRDLAGHDRVVVAFGVLEETAAARREIVRHPGAAEPQVLEVDDVDVGLQSHLETATVPQPVERGRVLRLLLHHEFEWQAFAAHPVTGPVRQHVGGDRGVADHAAVRAPVGETRHRLRVQEHLTNDVVALPGVVVDREEHHGAAVILEHEVVEQFERRHSLDRGEPRQGMLRQGFVVQGRTQRVQPVHEPLEGGRHLVPHHGRIRRKVLLAQNRRTHGRLAQAGDELRQRKLGECDERGSLGERMVRL